MSWVQLLLRWMHILPAVVAGGATVYAAIALVPTLGELPEDARRLARERIAARWRPVIGLCIVLLLVSGLANFLLFQAKLHKGQPVYHALFGVKFLLAMGVFFLASALSGQAPGLQPIRDRAGYWTGVAALLVVAILLVSGVLRLLPATA